MTDKELVDAYGNACLRAGQSNSGLCISPGASGDWEVMQKWREAVTKRLADACWERDQLRAVLTDLAWAADTAELLLQKACPGEAASLRNRVTAAKAALEGKP